MKWEAFTSLMALAFASNVSARDYPDICFDRKIVATPTAQISTGILKIDGAFVLSWPWIVDLQESVVVDGEFQRRTVTALAVLHGEIPNSPQTFLLRENDIGGYNLLRAINPEAVPLCSSDAVPMRAYLTLADGETFGDLRARFEAGSMADRDESEN